MRRRAQRTFTDDFKCEAVRLTQTSVQTTAQVVDDLGIGLSTLIRWQRNYRDFLFFPDRMWMWARHFPGFAKRMIFCVKNGIF